MPAPAASKAISKAVSSRDYYRYRRFEGVNLGSWFVNERWICDSVFANAAAPGQSDLDICKGSNAQKIFETHWDNWMTPSDWQFIVNQGMNTVRLPIGYYHLGQDSIIADTDFAPYGHGAWDRIMKAINTAASYGLGVLVDLHAAPGGQNTQPHSGTSSGQAKLWGNATNQARCLSALIFLVQKLSNIDNVIGLELLNEPSNGNYLAGWYIDTIKELRKYSSDFPIYIHDGFDPAYYAKFVGSHTDLGYVVQDTHFYRCFSASDTAKSSDAIIQQVITDTTGFWASMASWSKGRLIVGEWSAALADSSLKQSTRVFDSSRGYFAYVQLAMFKADVAAGWMFWTVKKESGKDTAWSLEDARKANSM
ncbi:glycoside hydrolase [Sistotremastrum suecicum HHB10207 ss-3]|uniref:Glycoside hydrolase n=1 Tax=Sistotremastrum suecicum HHB10207 ss-3 TaxID=1314776 RepID=A0A166BQW3_9AGAM|nr:glycoside hydrolase [Sistotremastrum suecicum HHB10207 ss-3]